MFEVRWKQFALNQLAHLWNQADSATRQAITDASNQIDHDLQHHPDNQGESRSGAQRILFVFPLGILFEVYANQSIVRVLQVWSFRRK